MSLVSSVGAVGTSTESSAVGARILQLSNTSWQVLLCQVQRRIEPPGRRSQP